MQNFATAGAGLLLASSFDSIKGRCARTFPNSHPRARTLFIAADFSGQHKGQAYETYSFLIFDLESNKRWMAGQRHFRENFLPSRRRLSFKALNDKTRRRCLVPFLHLADCIDGWLVSFAVSKSGESMFYAVDSENEPDILSTWKPHIREKLMRVIHLSAFLISGLSVANQDVLWIVDEDDIAANKVFLTQLTDIFGRVYSNVTELTLGNLRFGTAQSDDGSFAIEDLLAIADLAAGAFSEIATKMAHAGIRPSQDVITFLPQNLSWKSRLMTTWLAAEGSCLRRIHCVIDLDAGGSGMTAKILNWNIGISPH